MSELFRRMWLGVLLILATSAFLLLSDRKQRTAADLPRVAIFQFNSVVLLDNGVHGLLDRLRERGFENGRNVILERFNAENDVATANSMAQEFVSGRYSHVITVSTNCLQAVANANREGRVKHIFGVVADPIVAKVGINPKDPADHPKHMVGIGSLMPPGQILATARLFNPRVQRLGLPWNPSQANSERFTMMAREAAGKMGIELLEASVDNTAAVGETAASLVSRGAEGILVLGDLTVALGIDSVVAEARKGKIPVFSIMPDLVVNGALYGAGPDYYMIGLEMGDLTARVLKGEDTARIPIIYDVPKQVIINLKALDGLRDTWLIPPEVIAGAKKVFR